MRSLILGIISFFVFMTSSSLAETIYLKDGSVVSGEILQRGSYFVTVQVGKIPKKYFNDQIDRIEQESKDSSVIVNLDPAQNPDVAGSKVKLIESLLRVNGTQASMEATVAEVINNAPEDRKEEFRQMFDLSNFFSEMVPVYDKYFSENDLRELIQFYESPVGKKFLSVAPAIMKESMEKSVDYFQRKVAAK